MTHCDVRPAPPPTIRHPFLTISHLVSLLLPRSGLFGIPAIMYMANRSGMKKKD